MYLKLMKHALCLIFLFVQIDLNAQELVQTSFVPDFSKKSPTYQDTLALSNSTDDQYFGFNFGEGLLIAYNVSPLILDTVKIRSITIPFYGGLTSDNIQLSSARLKSFIWTNPQIDSTLILTNSFTESPSIDITQISAEQILPVTFNFADTSFISQETQIWIGIYYESSLDTINAISPVFNSFQNQVESHYQRDYPNDTLKNYTYISSHDNFWQNSDQIGMMDAFLDYEYKSSSLSSTSIQLKEKPLRFRLKAFPNPFNPSTTIQIQLNERSDVILEIFNVLGQRVLSDSFITYPNQLINYKVDLSNFSTGVYYAKVHANNSVRVIALTYLR